MPEGDTIARAARSLDQALAGHPLVRFAAPRLSYAPFPEGTVVEGARANGKHCLIRFDDGRVLRTHMQMTGSWHLYRPGERWRKKPAAMRALVETDTWVAVCFAAPVVELVPAGTPVGTEHLGPDLCLPSPDLEEGLRRMVELAGDRPVGEVLLDQRVVAGIGNIHKNEACFEVGVDPNATLPLVSDDERRRLLEVAHRNLRTSVATARMPSAVYGRRDRPCPRCGTTILWAPQGEQRRGTYWCPTCQPPRSA